MILRSPGVSTTVRQQTIPAGTYKWINISTDNNTYLVVKGDITSNNVNYQFYQAHANRLQTLSASNERDYIDLDSITATFTLNSEGTWTITLKEGGNVDDASYDYTNYLEAITETGGGRTSCLYT